MDSHSRPGRGCPTSLILSRRAVNSLSLFTVFELLQFSGFKLFGKKLIILGAYRKSILLLNANNPSLDFGFHDSSGANSIHN